MKLGIHLSNYGFSKDWVSYCQQKGIDYKIVNCYNTNIIKELEDCDALLWHHHHSIAEDSIFARQLLFSLEQSGKLVFPNFATGWHFDDKLGQKYLLEAIGAPIAATYVFYSKKSAVQWVKSANFPKVFKLRGGAGSSNVKLVKNTSEANRLIEIAFSRGFSVYDRWGNFKDVLSKFRQDKTPFLELVKSFRRLFVSTKFAKVHGRERGYVLLQEFIPNNSFDIRVVTIGNRAFALKRLVRKGDFRASGSGFIIHDEKEIDIRCVKIAFETSVKLNAICVAYDFVFNEQNEPLIVEINYGFAHDAYFKCPGFWDNNLKWHTSNFNSADWIIEEIIDKVRSRK